MSFSSLNVLNELAWEKEGAVEQSGDSPQIAWGTAPSEIIRKEKMEM